MDRDPRPQPRLGAHPRARSEARRPDRPPVLRQDRRSASGSSRPQLFLLMSRIEELADRYSRHISTPWQRTVSGAQRVIMVVYEKELERTLRARRMLFENATLE